MTHFFTGISVEVRIGIHPREKAAPQRVVIDLDYDCLQPADPNDEISAILNYDRVWAEVERIALSRHFNLQETLCRAILASLMARPEVVRARVSTRKPDIYANVEAVGVRMEARRADEGAALQTESPDQER